MKTTRMLATGWALMLALSATACPAAPGLEELVPGKIWAVPTEPAQVSAYIVKVDEDEALLIDAGAEEQATALLAGLDAAGLSAAAVSRVLLTHSHGDHLAGLAAFPEARVAALVDEAGLIAGTERSPRPLPGFGDPEPTGIRVDEPLAGGERLVFGDVEVEVFSVPGHTRGHAAYLVEGVLFLGDAATATDDGKLENALWLFSSDTDLNLDALKALHETLAPRADEIEVIACSHSRPLFAGLEPLTTLVSSGALD